MNELFRTLIKQVTANVVIVFLIASFTFFAYYRGEVNITQGIMITLFGSLTAISFYYLFKHLSWGSDSFGIQRSSPSIDGSISGWRLTTSSSLLLLSCVFTVATILSLPKDNNKDKSTGTMNSTSVSAGAGSKTSPDKKDSLKSLERKDTLKTVKNPSDSNKHK